MGVARAAEFRGNFLGFIKFGDKGGRVWYNVCVRHYTSQFRYHNAACSGKCSQKQLRIFTSQLYTISHPRTGFGRSLRFVVGVWTYLPRLGGGVSVYANTARSGTGICSNDRGPGSCFTNGSIILMLFHFVFENRRQRHPRVACWARIHRTRLSFGE